MFDTAKIVLSWRCNMNCSYCCNNLQHIKNSFQPIKQDKLIDLPHKDFELTGGELTMPANFSRTIEILSNWLPKERNYYFYTNGLWLNEWHTKLLKKRKVKGINVGYHNITLAWDRLIKCHNEIPIRLWVQDIDYKQWMDNLPFELRLWKLGECDEIRTDRYKLDFLS